MPDSIALFQRKLKTVRSSRNRIPILLELCKLYYRVDGDKALLFGKEAFQLAESLGQYSLIVKSLKAVAEAQFFLEDYHGSIKSLETVVTICDRLHDDLEKSIAYRLLEKPLSAIGELMKAMDLLHSALQIQERCRNEQEMMVTLRLIGKTYYKYSDYKRALEYAMQSLKLAKSLHDRRAEAYALDCVAWIYADLKQKDKALSLFFDLLAIFRELKDSYFECSVLGNIGTLYAELCKYDEALHYLNDALILCRKQHNTLYESFGYSNIAEIYINLGQNDKALAYSTRAFELAAPMDHMLAKTNAGMRQGTVLNALGRYQDALGFLLPLLPSMEDGKWQNLYCAVLEQIFISYERLNSSDEALKYHKILMSARMKEAEQQSNQNFRTLEERMEIERKEAEKEIYRLKAEQLEKDIDTRTREVASLGLQVVQKNEFLRLLQKQARDMKGISQEGSKSVRTLVKQIEQSMEEDSARDHFNEALDKLYSDFYIFLEEAYPALTKMERKICSLIKLQLPSKEIADLLVISLRTVEWHRLNIRKKFHIPETQETAQFLDLLFPIKS